MTGFVLILLGVGVAAITVLYWLRTITRLPPKEPDPGLDILDQHIDDVRNTWTRKEPPF